LYEKISLSNVANGALAEKFDLELEKIKENIADLNTEHAKPREIVIKIKMVPNEERNLIAFETNITSKLAPFKSAIGVLRLSQEKNNQLELFQDTSKQKEFENIDINDPESLEN
jgi:hypothetical protein